ncbi:MAG: hypothetical protein IKJ30_00930 [Bacilli bacterium]|nr:hypothetical protein [Bacilli bacterium]
MDKYQSYLYEYISIYPNRDGENKLSDYQKEKNKIILTQNENYNITKYTIYIASLAISKVEYLVGKKYIKAETNNPYTYSIELDFTKKSKQIKIYFKYDIADPLIIPIEYIESDKEKYDAKVIKEYKNTLKKKANVKVNTGDGIINVTFQPVSKSFSYSKVELYTQNQLMAKYKTSKDVYFCSITGLAYGYYEIILIQYDKAGKELYRSDYLSAVLTKPSSKPTVRPWY